MRNMNFRLTLLQSFNILFLIVFAYIFLNTILVPLNYFTNFKFISIVLGAIIILIGLSVTNRYLLKLNSKSLKIISVLSFIGLIGMQLFFAYFFKVNPTWDFGEVYYEAVDLSLQFRQIDPYFYLHCPNNLPILLVYTGLFKVFRFIGFVDLLTPLILVNLGVVVLSVFVMYLLIKEMYGLQRATLFSLLSLLITPFYTYTTIVYTDTLGMIFPILSLYLYAKIYKSNQYDWDKIIMLGVVLGVGALLKTHAAIVLVAILIHYLMTSKPRYIKSSLTMLLPVILVLISYQIITKPLIPISSAEVGFPKTHWIMMGLKGNGGFDDEDTNMTRFLKDSGYSNNQIQKEHLRIMKERLTEYGGRGFLEHLNNKLNFTWSDGTYFAPEKLKREPLTENSYQDYIFGDKNEAYLYFSQMVHVAIQFLVVVSAIAIVKKKDSFENVATISLFGVILFLLIWETRSRYLMIYLPVIVFLASHGFEILFECFEKIKRQ